MKYHTTVEQRKGVYIKAYEALLKEIANHDCTYVCPNLFDFAGICFYKADLTGELFPEFYAQKPKSAKVYDGWWEHTKDGDECRKNALQNAIALCEKEILNNNA